MRQSHPNKIIAYICLCDAYNYYQMFSRYIYCAFSWNYYLDLVFSVTVLEPFYYIAIKWFGADTVYDMNWEELQQYAESNDGIMKGSQMIRLASWYSISIAVSYMSLFFSTTIILDLYYVLKNPFSSTEARIKKFTILTVILSITFSALGLRLTLSKEKFLSSLNLILFILITILNFVLGIATMSFVFYRFRTKGMSK